MEIETMKSNVGMSWEKVSLDKLCTMLSGNAWTASKFKDEGEIPIIRIQNLGNNENEKFIWWDEPYDKKYIVTKGDILLSLSGSIKVDVWNGIDALLNQRIVKLIPNKNIDHKWFYWQITNIILDIERMGKWALVNNVSITDLKDLEIPLPPLATQKRIAEILDAADALRRKDQELLKKYDELAQAIFIDMFGDPVKNEKGWEVSALEDLCIDIVDCPHTTPNHTQEITDFPCIRTSEMKNRKISWGSMKYLNKEEYSKRVKRLIPEAGDIVYAREGTYGQAVLLPENYHFALGQRTMLLRPNSNLVSNEFLWYQINSDFVYRQAKRKNMGSTVGHVNVADVKKFYILVPPVQLQLKFTNAIINLISAESLFENQESDKLFDSLIQKAFKGELVA